MVAHIRSVQRTCTSTRKHPHHGMAQGTVKGRARHGRVGKPPVGRPVRKLARSPHRHCTHFGHTHSQRHTHHTPVWHTARAAAGKKFGTVTRVRQPLTPASLGQATRWVVTPFRFGIVSVGQVPVQPRSETAPYRSVGFRFPLVSILVGFGQFSSSSHGLRYGPVPVGPVGPSSRPGQTSIKGSQVTPTGFTPHPGYSYTRGSLPTP